MNLAATTAQVDLFADADSDCDCGVGFADDDFGQWSASFNGVNQDIELTSMSRAVFLKVGYAWIK